MGWEFGALCLALLWVVGRWEEDVGGLVRWALVVVLVVLGVADAGANACVGIWMLMPCVVLSSAFLR